MKIYFCRDDNYPQITLLVEHNSNYILNIIFIIINKCILKLFGRDERINIDKVFVKEKSNQRDSLMKP